LEILIEDIPESGLTVEADASQGGWFKQILTEALGESFGEDALAHLKLKLTRSDEEVDLKGDLIVTSSPTCDRCLKQYRQERTIPLVAHMTPLYENERQREREMDEGMVGEVVKEDEEFSYYEGDRIHLDEVVAEQLVLAEPMKHLCSENCQGLCQRCGKDLNEGPCNCVEEHVDPRWAPLKNLIKQ
jgi:uncharacterized protein